MLSLDLSSISLSRTENLTVVSSTPTVMIPNKVCLTIFNKCKWIFKTPSNSLPYRHLYFNGSSTLLAIAWTKKPQCSHSSVSTSNPSVDMTSLLRTKILGVIPDATLSNSTSIPPGNPLAQYLQINIKFNHFSPPPTILILAFIISLWGYYSGLLTGLSAYCLTHLEPIFKRDSTLIHLKHESYLVPPQSSSMSPHFTKKPRLQLALMLDSVWPFLLDLISYYSPSWRLCFSHTSQLALFTIHQIFT